MSTLYRDLVDLLSRQEAVAVATVIASRGSTPREVGAKMLILDEGRILGTVGGGCGEAQVLWEAVRVLREGQPRLTEVDLTGVIDDESPTNCGGIMEIFIDRLSRVERPAVGLPAAEAVAAARDALAARRRFVLVSVVATPPASPVPAGARFGVTEDGTLLGTAPDRAFREALLVIGKDALAAGRSRRLRLPAAGEVPALEAFVEAVLPQPELLIVGAGHIAVPLHRMAKSLDFRVVVLDDRAAFANPQRFPEADQIIAANIPATMKDYPLTPDTHLVLVTRGHQLDQEALKLAIHAPLGYIGMIGSKRRVRAVVDHLRRHGIPEERLAAVHAPIGLPIGAETPAEIAVSILAEIVAVRRAERRRSAR
ncbi:MAG: XdhC family protein [Candidatus Methylomirabilales bacterium]